MTLNALEPRRSSDYHAEKSGATMWVLMFTDGMGATLIELASPADFVPILLKNENDGWWFREKSPWLERHAASFYKNERCRPREENCGPRQIPTHEPWGAGPVDSRATNSGSTAIS
jgi:hypothetical protein